MHSLVRSLLYFRLKVKHYDFNFFRLCGVNNSWASFEGIPIIILLTKLRGFESLEEGNPAALKCTALEIYITKSFKCYRDLVNNSVDDNLEEMFFTACSGRSEISVIQFGRHNNTFPSLISRIDSVYEAEPSLPPCAVTASFSCPFFLFLLFVLNMNNQCWSTAHVRLQFSLPSQLWAIFILKCRPPRANCPFSRGKSVIIGKCIKCILVAGKLDLSLSQQIISLGEFLLCFHAI